jgi:hypothetical protein
MQSSISTMFRMNFTLNMKTINHILTVAHLEVGNRINIKQFIGVCSYKIGIAEKT